MRSDVLNQNSSSYGEQYKEWNIKDVTADVTLTAEDSGKLILVNPARNNNNITRYSFKGMELHYYS